MTTALERAEMTKKSFRGYGPRPNYDNVVFDLSDLLTARARRWLEYQTEEERQRFMVECTSNHRHFRRLHWDEREVQSEWIKTRDMTDEQYVEHHAYLRKMTSTLGGLLAEQIYQAANRPGFMRLLLAPPQHTVPEATAQEFKLARRLRQRLRHLTLREIVRCVRGTHGLSA